MHIDLSPENLLAAYSVGIFPMADEEGTTQWLAPDPRAIIELDTFKASRSLRAAVRKKLYSISINRAFSEVLQGCGDRSEGTWISVEISKAYTALHRLGFAHSVEAWSDGQLVGGLYGVSLGGAFFGESMFSRATDASKVALVYLVKRMKARRMVLLDVQFMTDHLRRFGAIEIARAEYERRLARAVALRRCFVDPPPPESE